MNLEKKLLRELHKMKKSLIAREKKMGKPFMKTGFKISFPGKKGQYEVWERRK